LCSRDDDGTVYVYKAAAPVAVLPPGSLQSVALRWTRLTLFGLALGVPLSVAARSFRVWAARRSRLRNREVPYVVGEAIRDPARFFGRQEILHALRNEIASRSFALVGTFRTGKTSIQHQLTRMLKEVNDPNHKYLPVFIDLQRFTGDDANFFHFLG